MNIDNYNVFTFSDSKIALSWINHNPSRLLEFVSNRVSKILTLVAKERWSYINNSSNSADLAARGLTAKQFLESKLWLNGPSWLANNFESHINIKFDIAKNIPELKNASFNVKKSELFLNILNRISSYNKCINVISYCYRYLKYLQKDNLNICPLTVNERKFTMNRLIHFS